MVRVLYIKGLKMERKVIGALLALYGGFALGIGSVIIIKAGKHKKLGWFGTILFASGVTSLILAMAFGD